MRIIVHVRTDRVGSRMEREVNIDNDDLERCDTDADRNLLIEDVIRESILPDMIEWGWKTVDPETKENGGWVGFESGDEVDDD